MDDVYLEHCWNCIKNMVDEYDMMNVIRVDYLTRGDRLGLEIDNALKLLNKVCIKRVEYDDFYSNILHKYGIIKENGYWVENIIRIRRQ